MMLAVSSKFLNVIEKKKEGKCFVDITVGLTIRKEFSVQSPVKIAYM